MLSGVQAESEPSSPISALGSPPPDRAGSASEGRPLKEGRLFLSRDPGDQQESRLWGQSGGSGVQGHRRGEAGSPDFKAVVRRTPGLLTQPRGARQTPTQDEGGL